MSYRTAFLPFIFTDHLDIITLTRAKTKNKINRTDKTSFSQPSLKKNPQNIDPLHKSLMRCLRKKREGVSRVGNVDLKLSSQSEQWEAADI